MNLTALVLGIIILIVGIILVPVGYYINYSALYTGILLVILGVIVSGVGAALKSKTVSKTTLESAKKEESAEGKMTTSAISSMMETLASADENLRRTMIKERLKSFASMDDEERADAMKMMMNALEKLNDEQLKKITYTRLESLAEDFDEEDREKLINTHMNLLFKVNPDYRKRDIQAMVSSMMICHSECRMKNMTTMKKVLAKLSKEQRESIMQLIPEEARKMLM